jgi:nicotianamine synthase-like protein
MKKEELIACVLKAHEVLDRETDLSPRNPAVNEVLSALVRSILEGCPLDEVKDVLDDPSVRIVRRDLIEKMALAEGEMERGWGESFCARESLAPADFRDFIYWDCYRHLVGAELGSLPPGLNLGRGQTIAFVGAGPLPLSAIIMNRSTGRKVTCIDRDPRACNIACELCGKAGLTDIDVTWADGADYDYTNCPIVFVASLVPEKAKVMRCIRERCPRACVALRSAEGLRTLLYDPVDESELEAMGCGFLTRTDANPQVINTTLFYEAAPRYVGKPVRPRVRRQTQTSGLVTARRG